MQTFLPYPSFEKSLKCLDYRRLGKQRVEAQQILHAIQGRPSRWRSHPAVKMWVGYTSALILYRNLAIEEWKQRGYKNTMEILLFDNVVLPDWLGGAIHASHRSNLLRKQPEYYSKYGWPEAHTLPYFWPPGKSSK